MEVRRPEFDEARTMMSAAEDAPDGHGLVASRVGADLRAARLRLGWTLEDVARGLRIRLPFLAAIEEGRIGDLPGAAYAVGFIRTYGQALGLDPDEIARRFRAEAHEVNRKTELTFPVPVPERGVPAGAVVLLGLVLAIGAYAAWYEFSSARYGAGEISSIPERFQKLAEHVAPGNTSPQVASILPPPAAQNRTAPPEASADAPASHASASSSAQAAPIATPEMAIPVPVPVPVSVTPIAPPAPPPPPTAPSDTSRVVLKFRADSYIQVREKGGRVLLNRVMRPGETWPVPNAAHLVMTTGNAGGTDIVVDGITAAPLGPSGAVRRDISLEPDEIKLPPGAKLPPQAR